MHMDPKTAAIAERYAMMIGLIVPRPIAVVGTCALDGGAVNLAPFSFFTGCGASPMTLLFCPVNQPDGSEKDTLRNAKPVAEGGQGEFTVSVCSASILNRVVACCEPLPYGESEFVLAGLTKERSKVVAPPGIAESPAIFECRTTHLIRLGKGVPNAPNILVGEVVHLRVDDAILDGKGRPDPGKLAAIGRMGALDFCSTRDRAAMTMGRAALDLANPFVSAPSSDTV